MKKHFSVPSFLGGFLVVSLGYAADLKQSKFTQVVNDVRVVSSANNVEKHAVGSSRVDLQACKLEYSIVSPK